MRVLMVRLLSLVLLCGGLETVLAGGTIGEVRPLPLNGDWNFIADPNGTLKVADLASAADVRPTRVPSSW